MQNKIKNPFNDNTIYTNSEKNNFNFPTPPKNTKIYHTNPPITKENLNNSNQKSEFMDQYLSAIDQLNHINKKTNKNERKRCITNPKKAILPEIMFQSVSMSQENLEIINKTINSENEDKVQNFNFQSLKKAYKPKTPPKKSSIKRLKSNLTYLSQKSRSHTPYTEKTYPIQENLNSSMSQLSEKVYQLSPIQIQKILKKPRSFIQKNMDKIQQQSFQNHQKNYNIKNLEIDPSVYKKFNTTSQENLVADHQDTIELDQIIKKKGQDKQLYQKKKDQPEKKFITHDFFRFKQLEHQWRQQEEQLQKNIKNMREKTDLNPVSKCLKKLGIKQVDPLQNYESRDEKQGNMKLIKAKIGIESSKSEKNPKKKIKLQKLQQQSQNQFQKKITNSSMVNSIFLTNAYKTRSQSQNYPSLYLQKTYNPRLRSHTQQIHNNNKNDSYSCISPLQSKKNLINDITSEQNYIQHLQLEHSDINLNQKNNIHYNEINKEELSKSIQEEEEEEISGTIQQKKSKFLKILAPVQIQKNRQENLDFLKKIDKIKLQCVEEQKQIHKINDKSQKQNISQKELNQKKHEIYKSQQQLDSSKVFFSQYID